MSDLTPEQEQERDELLEISSEMEKTAGSPWQPACVARAFLPARERVGPHILKPLTMEGWLALDSAHSIFLHGNEDPEGHHQLRELILAVEVLSGSPKMTETEFVEGVRAEEVVAGFAAVLRIVNGAFGTAIKMKEVPPPFDASKERPMPALPRRCGFGAWMLLYSKLLAMGISRTEARAYPVGEAFAIVAASAYLRDGMEANDVTYEERG